MEKDRIIFKGEQAKFKVTIRREDFDQVRDNFRIELCWGFFHQTLDISKDDTYVDEENNFYIIFDTSEMVGPVKAYCLYDVPDGDFETGIRTEVDIQWLCLVTDSPNPQTCCCHEPGGSGYVVYERVERGDVTTLFLNLRTSELEPILDADGKQMRVRKLGV